MYAASKGSKMIECPGRNIITVSIICMASPVASCNAGRAHPSTLWLASSGADAAPILNRTFDTGQPGSSKRVDDLQPAHRGEARKILGIKSLDPGLNARRKNERIPKGHAVDDMQALCALKRG